MLIVAAHFMQQLGRIRAARRLLFVIARSSRDEAIQFLLAAWIASIRSQ
jgi:hypothetical protein